MTALSPRRVDGPGAEREHSEPPAEAEPSAGRWWATAVAVPLALYLLTRLTQLGLVALMAPDDDIRLDERLLAWDAGWFTRVADDGYPTGYSYGSDGQMIGNGLAFFPAYPLLLRVIAWLPGISTAGAALTVSWIAGAAAAVLLAQLGERLYSRQTGYALAVLFGAQPMSVVLSMGYTEALFCAFVAGTLLAVHRNAWLVAGGSGFLAAMTRPTGAALALALLATAIVWMWRDRGDYPTWRVAVGTAAALAGAPLYLLWVALRVGDLDAWFRIQEAGWGTHWDYGATTLGFLRDAFRGEAWVQVSTAVVIVVVAACVLVALSERVWLPLSLSGVLAFAMAVGSSGYYHSRPRMLVPVLLWLVPLAVAVGRARPRTAVVALAGATLLGGWYGAYMITVWPFTI
ncbi:MAG: hypothetical protein GEU94_09880 [Micromonosporaceae bacterium]|nr:hypothetical protein [Micromonosporaceae bacterium]